MAPVRTLKRPSKTLWSVVFLLVLIAVAAVVRRLFALSAAPGTGPTAGLDLHFLQYRALTLAHILPALLFILLAPLQFVTRLRTRMLRLHRWLGRVLVCLGLVIGVSAMLMNFTMAVGGVSEISAVLLFDSLFLFFLTKGYLAIRRGDVVRHREWMIRMFGIALAVSTVRPVMGIFFATAPLTHLTPHDFFGTAFWIGFTVTLIAAESWINYTRRSTTPRPSPPVLPEPSKETRSPSPTASVSRRTPAIR